MMRTVSSHTSRIFFYRSRWGYGDFDSTVPTSENAGAAIFRYLFHSSPSAVTMLLPKTFENSRKGLGNLERAVVTSYKP